MHIIGNVHFSVYLYLQVLDPSYTPVDVRPHKNIFITLSFDDLPTCENGHNSSSVLQVMSEEPHHNTITALDNSFELPEMNMALHSTKSENEDSVKTTEEDTPINIAHNNDCRSKDECSSHFIGFSDAYIYSNEQDIEIKTVGYVESTELELPSLSCECPESPAVSHNTCFTAVEAETLPTSPCINDCLNCDQEPNSSHNIECLTATGSPTDVLYAFELVDSTVCNAANLHSPSPEFMCDSSDAIPKSTIATSLPQLIIAKPSPKSTPPPELIVSTSTPELNCAISTPKQDEEDTTLYISSELP